MMELWETTITSETWSSDWRLAREKIQVWSPSLGADRLRNDRVRPTTLARSAHAMGWASFASSGIIDHEYEMNMREERDQHLGARRTLHQPAYTRRKRTTVACTQWPFSRFIVKCSMGGLSRSLPLCCCEICRTS